ncbi:subtilisin family serine protease [Streptosporangium becharense]|uniref:Subtilisin family serine protease n=1 Tax=Streptosporangium becharense TaxID=1816182 RepID=A0A7W9ILN7_9ACTN|nr:S8 family serine peptidase [Streptosporangium becharense]MBB2910204.1 subtilisin family serine protease [Streptosporangium becharense]MBB5822947.1 subtilisin family serine protease [Streptosporangium becharense]
MRVLLQLRPSPDVVAAVADPAVTTAAADVADTLPGVVLDPSFAPVVVPRPVPGGGGDPLSLHQPLTFSMAAGDASVLVRGEISDDEISTRVSLLPAFRPDVVGVFADPVIGPNLTCGGDPPVGDWHDVERLLRVAELAEEGLDGSGVAVAVLDTGINARHVTRRLDREVSLDAGRSWSPAGVNGGPGEFTVDHGTMCAFDALIAAPRASLIDVPVLLSRRPGGSALDGLLSDAIAAFAHLRTVLEGQPAGSRSLVISNSWGSFSPLWDFPVGHPGNYSDNPAHPFNLIISSLDRAGADVLFAAGNCGRECRDGRCAYPDRPIAGANSHPDALSVGGVDVRGDRVGYSSQGPGRLTARKPDLCCYTHFAGSGAFGDGEPDSGTSAACPVAAGVVAAVRTLWPSSRLSPAQLRTLLRRTADDRSDVGFDDDYGYGVLDTRGLIASLRRRARRVA